jgi:hypothetical protein
MLWYGIIRRKDGKHVYGTAPIQDFPSQSDFLKKRLHMTQGDTVLDLFQNDVGPLEPYQFNDFCQATYIKKSKDGAAS